MLKKKVKELVRDWFAHQEFKRKKDWERKRKCNVTLKV